MAKDTKKVNGSGESIMAFSLFKVSVKELYNEVIIVSKINCRLISFFSFKSFLGFIGWQTLKSYPCQRSMTIGIFSTAEIEAEIN